MRSGGGRAYGDVQGGQPVDGDIEAVAGLDGADAGGGACVDQVAGAQPFVAADMGDDLGRAPDHVGDVGGLTGGAVEGEADGAACDMAAVFHRAQRAERGGEGEVFRGIPGAAAVAGGELQVAPGHVQAGGIAEDQAERVRRRHVCTGLADGDHQFGFVVEVLCFRRIRDGAAAWHQRVRPFGEEEGGFAGIHTHFLGVGGVVAADAEDAADGEALGAALYGGRRALGQSEAERHGGGSSKFLHSVEPEGELRGPAKHVNQIQTRATLLPYRSSRLHAYHNIEVAMKSSRDPRWIVLSESGDYSTLGRHSEPDDSMLKNLAEALVKANLGGWLAIMSSSLHSSAIPEFLMVRCLRPSGVTFDAAVKNLLRRRAHPGQLSRS